MELKWLQHVFKSKPTYKHPVEGTTEWKSRHEDSSRQADNHYWSSYLDKEDATGRSGPPAMGMSFPSLGSPSLQNEGHYTCSIDPTELWLELVSTGAPESLPERHPPAIPASSSAAQ